MEDRPKRNHIHHTAFPAPMEQHEIVSEEEWKKARAQLLEKEKALTRHIDEVCVRDFLPLFCCWPMKQRKKGGQEFYVKPFHRLSK
jgi:hypothetical protein